MPPDIGSAPPASIMQGDTLRWRFASTDATPATATLTVRVSSASQTVEVTGTADGTAWLITVTADQTKRLGSGILRYVVRAAYAGGIVQTISGGTITAVALPELGTGSATMSHAARMVALLEVQLEQLAADALEQYSVGERSATRRKMMDVRSELNAAKRALAMEQNGGRLPRIVMQPRPMPGFRPLAS